MRLYLSPVLFLAACDLGAVVIDGESDKSGDPGNCPAAAIDHTALDWQDVEAGSRAESLLVLTNDCEGEGDLSVEAELSGAAFSTDATSWTLAPGATAEIIVAYQPDNGTADAGSLLLTTNDEDRPEISVTLSGVPVADDDNDGSPATEDCDDQDDTVYPGANDIPYDDVDSNCDGRSDFDQDLDGFESSGFGGDDCNDVDASVFPGAGDTPYDGIDQDCGGDSDYDADRDGFESAEYGGDDCDDTVATTYPGATDTPYDEIDADCAGDDDNDADSDGHASSLFGGDDCDDFEPTTYPSAADAWYDGVDSDCNGWSDFDADLDGYDSVEFGGDDCDDTLANTYPGASDPWYDGADTDCAGNNDLDQDADGQDASLFGGSDCNDTDATVYEGAVDTWYDGTDGDCAGNDDYDQDADGDASSLFTGNDCDDLDVSIYTGADDPWYDGIDSNCDGESDYDQDADGQEAEAYGGDDCDDETDTTYSGAADTWYDGLDADCAGNDDYDQDADGDPSVGYGGQDCDDINATIYDGAIDAWYDGVDSNCDEEDDFDQDGDSHLSDSYGGDDCDDTAATTYTGAADAWYDGIDSNCDGESDFDKDGDGDDLIAYGGGDCVDTDAGISSLETEVWYDGIDSDCAGDDDNDQDGDGHAIFPAGDDCDDTDATSTTSASGELDNGLDDDCDGLIDEDFVDPGDLILTELMVNPSSVSDTVGEWFEVYNTTADTIDMLGWVIYSDDGNYLTISRSLPVAPGEYVVLGVEDNTTTNGGVTLDYEYSRTSFSFADTSDSIYFVNGSTTVIELSFTTSSWPMGTAGKAMALDDDHYGSPDNGTATYWCAADDKLTGGDYGTPGASHGNCYLDDDGDGARLSDCDDDDPLRGYTMVESVNSIDDDCNGYVDEEVLSTSGVAYLAGATSSAYVNFAGVADFDNDGQFELAAYHEAADTAYFLPGSTYSTWAGLPSAYDDASFTTASSAQNFTGSPDLQSDVTGDGIVDFAYTNYASSTYGFTIHAGPFTGTATSLSPDYRFGVNESAGTSFYRLNEGYDVDGDGVNELIYSNAASKTDGFSNSGAIAVFERSSLAASMDYDDATLVLTGGVASANLGYRTGMGDLNGDGYDDVVASTSASTTPIYVWLSDAFATTGKNTMSVEATATVTPGGAVSYFEIDDVDADGTLDAAVGSTGTVKWYFDVGSFSGTVSSPTPDALYDPEDYGSSYWYTTAPSSLRYDADGDGDDEVGIIGYNFFSDYVYAFFAPDAFSDGVVTGDEASLAFTLPVFSTRSRVADLDANGQDEIILSEYTWSSGGAYYVGGIWIVEP